MRSLDNECNCQPNGSKLYYSACMVRMEEELLFLELGERVGVAILTKAIDLWDALMDLEYSQYASRYERNE